jgi:predicted acyltransferase
MPHTRLESLDVFRGLTIAAMILVSTPGTWDAVYPPLEHALWHGWTPTDLVFPFLLFAMGAAVPFAMVRRREARRSVHRHVIRRGAILFAMGLVLNAIEAPPPLRWATFRVPGVLQRIALVYLAVAWLTEHTTRRTQAMVAAACVLGYWALMVWVPVPGVGAGILTPEGNLASYIDRLVLHRHLNHPLWDPEGLLITIPAIATALAGVFAGDWLNRSHARHQTLLLVVAGVAVMAAGLLWGRVFPINKNLWTSSFVLFSAGLAMQVLAVCHWILDVHHTRRWAAPFVAFGRNPLPGYFLSVALDSAMTRWRVGGSSLKWTIFYNAFAVRIPKPQAASLAYAVTYVALWAIVLGIMHRRRVFIGI